MFLLILMKDCSVALSCQLFTHRSGVVAVTVIDREFEFYKKFSFLKFNEFYKFFFGWKKFRKNS